MRYLIRILTCFSLPFQAQLSSTPRAGPLPCGPLSVWGAWEACARSWGAAAWLWDGVPGGDLGLLAWLQGLMPGACPGRGVLAALAARPPAWQHQRHAGPSAHERHGPQPVGQSLPAAGALSQHRKPAPGQAQHVSLQTRPFQGPRPGRGADTSAGKPGPRCIPGSAPGSEVPVPARAGEPLLPPPPSHTPTLHTPQGAYRFCRVAMQISPSFYPSGL